MAPESVIRCRLCFLKELSFVIAINPKYETTHSVCPPEMCLDHDDTENDESNDKQMLQITIKLHEQMDIRTEMLI